MLEKLEFVTDYMHDDKLRNSFFDMVSAIFGLSFDRWFELGYCDGQYRCYSLVHDGRIVANVSATDTVLTVMGSQVKALQLGTVATLREYRGKGLARVLMDKVLATSAPDLVYLFANDSVLDFYPRFGFQRTGETCYRARPTPGAASRLRRLDVASASDRALIWATVESRVPVSNVLGVSGGPSIFMWHSLNTVTDCLLHLPDRDALLVAKADGSTLRVYDVVAADRDSLSGIFTRATFPGVDELIFHLVPDRLGIEIESEEWLPDDELFVRGSGLPQVPFIFPITSKT